MTTVTVTEAKDKLLDLLRGVEERGERVQITRKGLLAGVLVSAQEWESLLETVDILSDPVAMRKVARARRELATQLFLTHDEVWSNDAVPRSLSSRRRKGPSTTPRRRSPKSAARHRASGRRTPGR